MEDIQTIMGYGVLSTPALVIDGIVKSKGIISKVEETQGWIK